MFAFYALLPLALMLMTAFATSPQLRARKQPPTRFGLSALALQVLSAALVTFVVIAQLGLSTDDRCPLDSQVTTVVLLAGAAVAVTGGLLLGAVAADARRQGGVLVWHLPAGLIAFVLPYVVYAELLYWGLTCTS